MRIRYLRISITTENGLHGVDINFPDGLVILHADNSMGKSTCLQSIIVALGLEAMLTTNQHDLPLPPVLKDELESNGKNVKVLESEIFLEIENSIKERVVVHRTVKGSRNKDLITVTFGPLLTNPQGQYTSKDYFVSRQGSATREAGFHYYLAKFLGWELPEVQTYDGRQSLLYLQCIFPFFFVEQKHGWASLLPPMPTQFRIREPHQRAIEFLLRLDSNSIAAKRIELNEKIKNIESEWAMNFSEVEVIVQILGGVVRNLPNKPIVNWPPKSMPYVQVWRDGKWLQFEESLTMDELEIQNLKKQEVPKITMIKGAVNQELLLAQENLIENELVLENLINSLEMDSGEIKAIENRLKSLDDDIQQYKDVKTIAALGSMVPNITKQLCPTCHQHIEDSLLPPTKDQQIMTVDDNISFLEEQDRTYKAALKNSRLSIIAKESQMVQLREKINNIRIKIRSIQETLVSDERLPSIEVIRTRIELEAKLERYKSAMERFCNKIGQFEPLASSWFSLQKEKENLPKENVSENDKNKLKKWNELFGKQLSNYDFQSLPVDTVYISNDTYFPVHEGYDLPTNISASDFIRIIWSYLTGLFKLSRFFSTNHPGILIFDEPRQQSAKNLSFSALLKELSDSKEFNQQVIFATSENIDVLNTSLREIPHTLYKFDGRIIKPIKL